VYRGRDYLSVRLLVCQLEDRLNAAAYYWCRVSGAPGDFNWSTMANWKDSLGVPATALPGPDDSVYLSTADPNISMNSSADLPKVRDVFADRVSISIPAQNTLEVTGLMELKNGTGLRSSDDDDGELAVLKMTGSSELKVTSGTGANSISWLHGMDLRIGTGTNHNATATFDAKAGKVEFSNVTLRNYGTVKFMGKAITGENVFSPKTSTILNLNGGKLEVSVADGILFDGMFDNYEGGEVKFNSGTSSDIFPEFNNYGGTVRVYTGSTPQFLNHADQTAGVFELRGGNVSFAINTKLRITGGVLTGSGNITGEVELGYPEELNGTSSTTPSIRPGISDDVQTTMDIGTLTASKISIYSSLASVVMELADGASYDRINANTFHARGALSITTSTTYNPTLNTTKRLIDVVWQNGLSGDFSTKSVNPSFYWNHDDNPGRQHYWVVKKTATGYDLVVELVPIQPPPGGGGGGSGGS
jgi:hypothetical protein